MHKVSQYPFPNYCVGECTGFDCHVLLSQKPMVFDNAKIMEQLHYLGMVDTIKVRRMGYSVRYPHEVRLATHKKLKPYVLLHYIVILSGAWNS